MNTPGLFSKVRGMRIIVVFVALLLAYGAVSYSPQAATPTKLYSFDLGGVTGATNNTTLAYGRFVLIAPFWPSTGLKKNGDLDLSKLDNDTLYVIDTKKPDAPPLSQKLSAKPGAQNRIYFPTRVLFDEPSSSVYVRGTRFEENDGEFTPIDVIAYMHVTPDDNGKPVLDFNVVAVDIQGVSTQYTDEAPLDFALSGKGDLLVFTNGASIFSFNLAEGYLSKAEVVSPSQYSAGDRISFLDVDSATNIVSVCNSRKSIGRGNVANITTDISFYKLGERGIFDPLKQVSSYQFPDGTALADGSNITIVSDSDSPFAVFVTNDGSLCQVDLQSDGVAGMVKPLYSFPELAQSPTGPNPLLTQYDSSNRVIGIVKPGFTVQISRPTSGKPGRISRPTSLHLTSAAPVLAMAKLSKKNKVTSAKTFTQDFKDEDGLSNFVSGQDSQWLISTYSGKLYSVGIAGDLQGSKLQLIGSIGSRVDRIDYYADRTIVVAISSCTLDEDGIQIRGSLVVGKLSDLHGQSGGATLQALLPTASMIGRPAPSISRPCNIKR